MLSALPLTFVTIVEAGSITKAADTLNLAKSAVSQNLKRLEEQLGVKLAARTTRQLSLTPAGERYYKRCKEMLALSNRASTEMEDFGAAPAGPITITAPHAMMTPIIAPALLKVRKRFPRLIPKVIADDKRLDLIGNGIDIAISVGDLPDSNLKARRVGTLQDTLSLSPGLFNELTNNQEVLEENLQNLPYIAHFREGETTSVELTSKQTGKTLRLSFQPTVKCNTIEALASFAREGLGVALLPDIAIAQDLKKGLLVRLLPEYNLKPLPIYAVHVYEKLPPLSVLEVITAIEEAMTTASLDD